MPKETNWKSCGSSSPAKLRGAKKQQASKKKTKKDEADRIRVNPALTDDDLRVSAYSKRGAGKQSARMPGGVIYEKAQSRHARGRAALLDSGSQDDATPLGTSRKRVASRRGPNTTADMPSEMIGRGTPARRRPLSQGEATASEQETVESLMKAGTNFAKRVQIKAREGGFNSDSPKRALIGYLVDNGILLFALDIYKCPHMQLSCNHKPSAND